MNSHHTLPPAYIQYRVIPPVIGILYQWKLNERRLLQNLRVAKGNPTKSPSAKLC